MTGRAIATWECCRKYIQVATSKLIEYIQWGLVYIVDGWVCKWRRFKSYVTILKDQSFSKIFFTLQKKLLIHEFIENEPYVPLRLQFCTPDLASTQPIRRIQKIRWSFKESKQILYLQAWRVMPRKRHFSQKMVLSRR